MKIDVSVGRSNFVKYDESLFEVYVLDFQDNYHRTYEPKNELEAEARNIKGRYRNINKYRDAVNVYHEYMDYLYQKYGGKKIFKLRKKMGDVDDFIPPKPRIKKTKEMKFLKKNKIVLSVVDNKNFIDYDAMEKMAKLYSGDIEDVKLVSSKDKYVNKIADDINLNTRKSYYGNSNMQAFDNDMDYLDYFFKNKNKFNKKKKKGKNNIDDGDVTIITDLMRGDYKDYFFSKDDLMSDSDSKPMMYSQSLMLSTGTVKDLEIYKALNDWGWNSYKILKKTNYSDTIAEAFKPPKKKKKDKKNKNKNGMNNYDGLIIDIMTENGVDLDDIEAFEDFQREMLSMTSEDMYKSIRNGACN